MTPIALKNCCCTCNVGSYVPRWKNVTAVRTQSDCADPTTKATVVADGTNIPAARLDISYSNNSGGEDCPGGGFTCGKCGGWLVGGDLSGLSAQEVTAGTDDIVAGATPDATHYTVDNNSYQAYPNAAASFFQVGDIAKIVTLGSTDWNAMAGTTGVTYKVGDIFTVAVVGSGSGTAQLMTDMLMARRRGGQWIFAQKYWHGVFGYNVSENCVADPTVAASLTKYRTATVTLRASVWHYVGGFSGTKTLMGTDALDWVASVNQTSGIVTSTFSRTCTETSAGNWVFFIYAMTVGAGVIPTLYGLPSLCPGADIHYDITNYIDGTPSSPVFTKDIRNQVTTETSFGNYEFHFNLTGQLSTEITVTVTLSDPYTSEQLAADFMAAENAWDMSDFKRLNSLRMDENLAHSALCTYAEHQGVASQFAAPFPSLPTALPISAHQANQTMDDYSSPAKDSNGFAPWTYDPLLYAPNTGTPLPSNYATWTPVSGQGADWTPTWAQIAWHDPQDCIWQTQALPAHGIYFTDPATVGYFPANFTSASLRTGIYDGSIIAHTSPSSGICARHFWFNAITYRREENYIEPEHISTGTFNWNTYSHGAYSDGQLPWPTMRWLPGYLEQYDSAFHVADGHNQPNGTFGQQFTDFPSNVSVAPQGLLVGGKYCQAVQKWQAVNFGRPCGIDRYAVDQTTVVGVASVTAGVYTVFQTGISTNNQPAFIAKAPLAAGGLQNNDYIMIEGTGVFKILTITAIGNDAKGRPNWTIAMTVAGKLDDPPTGYAFSDPEQRTDGYTHLGRLRWLGYTQFGGTFSSAPGIDLKAAVTMSLVSGTPTIASAGGLPYLRIDPTTAAIRPVNLYDAAWTLLVSGLAITRTDDNNFTAAVNYPTAAWMMDTQFATAISASATTDWTKYDSSSKQTGVHIGWSFNQRMVAAAAEVVATTITAAQFNTAFSPVTYPPTWIGGSSPVAGVLDSSYSIAQFNYPGTMSCPAIVGIVPDGSPENFGAGQVLFGFPAVPVDSIYGAHSQSYIGLTMEDPFNQPPFKPDCDYDPTGLSCPWSWREDDGSGMADVMYSSGTCVGELQTAYYAMRPMVEALSSIPSGCSLPTGVTLYYDPANKFPPPNYPNGIPLGANVTSDWGTTNRICNNVSRFVADYAAWANCP